MSKAFSGTPAGRAAPLIITREEAAALVKKNAHAAALVGTALAALTADQLKASAKHQPGIDLLLAEIAAGEDALKVWAEANRAPEFGAAQSLDFAYGSLKFRLGKPTLGILPKWSWALVTKALTGKKWEKFLRLKAEPNKAALLAAVAGDAPEVAEEDLKKIGVVIYQEETFAVEYLPAD